MMYTWRLLTNLVMLYGVHMSAWIDEDTNTWKIHIHVWLNQYSSIPLCPYGNHRGNQSDKVRTFHRILKKERFINKEKRFSKPHERTLRYFVKYRHRSLRAYICSRTWNQKWPLCVDTSCLLGLGSFLSNYGRLYLEMPGYLRVLPRVATADVITHNFRTVSVGSMYAVLGM